MAGDAIATKIVELSKKNRVLMAEAEGAKTRVKQQNKQIQELEREVRALLIPASGGDSPLAGPLLHRGSHLGALGPSDGHVGQRLQGVPQPLSHPERGMCVRKPGGHGSWRDRLAQWLGHGPGAWLPGCKPQLHY